MNYTESESAWRRKMIFSCIWHSKKFRDSLQHAAASRRRVLTHRMRNRTRGHEREIAPSQEKMQRRVLMIS
jgi:hypothetical protein